MLVLQRLVVNYTAIPRAESQKCLGKAKLMVGHNLPPPSLVELGLTYLTENLGKAALPALPAFPLIMLMDTTIGR